MKTYNLNNKKFVLLENSNNGEVNSTTIFEYQQKEDLVTAQGKLKLSLDWEWLNETREKGKFEYIEV